MVKILSFSDSVNVSKNRKSKIKNLSRSTNNQHSPYEETGGFADEQQDECRQWRRAIKAYSQHQHIANERHPRQQREPRAVTVNARFVARNGLGLDAEHFLNPFPFCQPAAIVGDHAAQPVANGGHHKTRHRPLHCRKCGYIECVGTKRYNCGRQKIANE